MTSFSSKSNVSGNGNSNCNGNFNVNSKFINLLKVFGSGKWSFYTILFSIISKYIDIP